VEDVETVGHEIFHTITVEPKGSANAWYSILWDMHFLYKFGKYNFHAHVGLGCIFNDIFK